MNIWRTVFLLLVSAACLGACDSEVGETQGERPNVLLIIVDDLNTDLGAFGSSRTETPNIDRLAQRGVTFMRAYAQYPQCNQSRTSFLTGLYPHQTGVLTLAEHFRDHVGSVTTLPQHFKDNGYFSARVGKVFHQGVPNEIGHDGLDDPLSWNVAVNPAGMESELDASVKTIVPAGEKVKGFGGTLSWLAVPGDGADLTDSLVTDTAIGLLQDHHPQETGKPFFLAVGYYRPHTPFIAPVEFFSRIARDDIELPFVPEDDRDDIPVAALADRPHQQAMSDELKREVIQAYLASVSFVDAQIGRLTDGLQALDLGENTIIVFMSDHGYQLGQHGLWQKGDLFEGSTHTPLIIAAGGFGRPGERRDDVVELVDVYPTLVAMAGLPMPTTPLSGENIAQAEEPFRPALSQARSRASWTRPELHDQEVMGFSIRTGQFRFTEWNDGVAGAELYDHREDPDEYYNLAGRQTHADIAIGLRQALREAHNRGK